MTMCNIPTSDTSDDPNLGRKVTLAALAEQPNLGSKGSVGVDNGFVETLGSHYDHMSVMEIAGSAGSIYQVGTSVYHPLSHCVTR